MRKKERFRRYIEPHFSSLHHFLSIKSPPDEVDDLFQNTLIRVWKSLDSFRAESSYKTWMLQIARRELADFYRNRKAPMQELDKQKLSHEGFEQSLVRQLDYQELKSELAEQDQLLLYYLFDAQFSYDQIAQEMNLKLGTVKSRIYYLRKKLRKHYKKGDEHV